MGREIVKPVLVTGGAGYIGSHTVVELIREGIDVVVLDNLSTGHRGAVRARHFYEGDISDPLLVEHIIKEHEVRSVIHFAAKSLVSESVVNPDLYFYENTVKSLAFFRTAVKAGVENIVFSSTAAVYGIPDHIPVREDVTPAPINPYGASKRMVEEFLYWMGKAYGIKWVALRYFNAAGASTDGQLGEDHRPETHLIPLAVQTALGRRGPLSIFGTDYETPDGTCIRDYIHVSDLADAHILVLKGLAGGMPSRIFNVGTGRGNSVLEIIKGLETISGHMLPVAIKPRREGDPPVLVADSTAIEKELGWKARYSNIKEILRGAWQWHSNYPGGPGF